MSPPPLDRNWEKFEMQTILIKVILQNNCNIIEIGKNVKNSDPPLQSKQSTFEMQTILILALPPPPLWTFPQFVTFFVWKAPLSRLHGNIKRCLELGWQIYKFLKWYSFFPPRVTVFVRSISLTRPTIYLKKFELLTKTPHL